MNNNNTFVIQNNTTSSYVIQVECVAETKYRARAEATTQEVIEALVNHFDKAIKYLQTRKKEIFN